MKSTDFKNDVNLIQNFERHRNIIYSLRLLSSKFHALHVVISVPFTLIQDRGIYRDAKKNVSVG